MEQKLLRLLLQHDFYEANKGKLIPTMFGGNVAALYETIRYAHDTYGRDLTLEELRQLHFARNETLTRAAKTAVGELLLDLGEASDVGPDIAQEVLHHMWRTEIGRQVAEMGLRLMEGKTDSIDDVRTLVDSCADGFVPADDGTNTVTDDIEEVLQTLDTRPSWTFNIPAVAEICPGISAGEFLLYLARPEMGKTAKWVSDVFAPGGFAEQGASVLAICNEEPAIRTRLRGICSYTGMNANEIRANPARAKERYAAIAGRVKMLDTTDMTMTRLDRVVKSLKPDIVVLDQIDKVPAEGVFSRSDEALGETYVQFRQICKRHACAGIALTQASAEAEGKTRITYSMAANSRTAKAAEPDVIIGIGKPPEDIDNNPVRTLYFSKNKIGAGSSTVFTMINPALSRYTE